MHRTSIAHMRGAVARHVAGRPAGLVADIGAASRRRPWYRQIWEAAGWTYTGVDLVAGKNVDVVLADPFDFPFPDGRFDAVISGQMLEHNEMFWLSFVEMNRVLRQGGLMVHIAPSRGPEHRAPQDCWRFYRDGMTALGRWSGFEVIEATTDFLERDVADYAARHPARAGADADGGVRQRVGGYGRRLPQDGRRRRHDGRGVGAAHGSALHGHGGGAGDAAERGG
jgi:SAM-dependent methyltransferase